MSLNKLSEESLERLINVAKEAAKLTDRDDIDDAIPMVMMTFGEIPPKELFEAHWEAVCRTTLFNITPGAGQSLPFSGDFTCEEMWVILNDAVKEGDMSDDENSPLNLLNGVMGILRFEWV